MGTEGATDRPVQVPEEFRRIGYSGQFHLTIPVGVPKGNPERALELLEEMARSCPKLSPTPGWMYLSVDVETMTAVVVRRDADAVVEALTRGQDTIR